MSSAEVIDTGLGVEEDERQERILAVVRPLDRYVGRDPEGAAEVRHEHPISGEVVCVNVGVSGIGGAARNRSDLWLRQEQPPGEVISPARRNTKRRGVR